MQYSKPCFCNWRHRYSYVRQQTNRLFTVFFTTNILIFSAIVCKKQKSNTHNDSNPLEIYFSAIENSVYAILKVCALICFFTAILSLVEHTVLNFFALFLEVSCGCSLGSALFETSPLLSISACGFCLGFSGICVHAQVISVAKSIKISYFKFLLAKLMQGIACSAISAAGYYLFFMLELL